MIDEKKIRAEQVRAAREMEERVSVELLEAVGAMSRATDPGVSRRLDVPLGEVKMLLAAAARLDLIEGYSQTRRGHRHFYWRLLPAGEKAITDNEIAKEKR